MNTTLFSALVANHEWILRVIFPLQFGLKGYSIDLKDSSDTLLIENVKRIKSIEFSTWDYLSFNAGRLTTTHRQVVENNHLIVMEITIIYSCFWHRVCENEPHFFRESFIGCMEYQDVEQSFPVSCEGEVSVNELLEKVKDGNGIVDAFVRKIHAVIVSQSILRPYLGMGCEIICDPKTRWSSIEEYYSIYGV